MIQCGTRRADRRPGSSIDDQVFRIPGMRNTRDHEPDLVENRSHQMLYHATRGRHRILDAHLRLKRLLSSDITIEAYIDSLRGLRHCYRAVEIPVQEFEKDRTPVLANSYVPRAWSIDKDLRALGVPTGDPFPATAPIESLGYYFGVRYVLEGSSRGGRHIAGALARRLPCLADRAFEFWTLQCALADRWGSFLAGLTELDVSSTHRRDAVRGARAGFDTFLGILDDRWAS